MIKKAPGKKRKLLVLNLRILFLNCFYPNKMADYTIQYGSTGGLRKYNTGDSKMREPTVKSIYKDTTRNIIFEVLYYVPMEEKQIRQVLDEYYRRYNASFPEEGSTVRVICDNCGPRPPE